MTNRLLSALAIGLLMAACGGAGIWGAPGAMLGAGLGLLLACNVIAALKGK